MKVIKTTFTDKKDIYRTTKNASIGKLSELADNEEITISGYTLFEDTDKDENIITVLALMLENGTVYATNSATVIKDFNDILEIFEEFPLVVKKGTGTSKANRSYMYLYIQLLVN